MPKHPIRNHDHMWKNLSNDDLKIIIDATFQDETLSGAMGAAARGGRGNFISAAIQFLPHVGSAGPAEMTTIRNGLFLAARIYCNNLLIDSNYNFVLVCKQRAINGFHESLMYALLP